MLSSLMILFFLILLFLGLPVIGAMGLAAVAYIVGFMNIPLNIVGNQILAGVSSVPLMAIPFFIISGALMESGGISKRIIGFATAIVGSFPGGMGLVVIIASAFFAAMTGSGAACVAAIGGMMIPAMVNNGYDVDFSCALQAAGGTLGPIIPPSILMVLYSCSTGNSVGDMLLAGLFPGLLVALNLILVTLFISKKREYKGEGRISLKNIWKSFKESIFALLTPVIILGGIYSGLCTPTEASALSCLYAIVIGLFVYRELKIKDLMRCLYDSVKIVGQILGIVAVTQLFSWILTRAGLPHEIAALCSTISNNPKVFMLIISLILLAVGCFLDPVPAVLIFAPILVPAAVEMGINPIHFGVVMVTTFCIGLVTPPVGMTLFVSAGIGNRPVMSVSKQIMPFLISMFISVIIIILIPQLSLLLPMMARQ
ncbi:TRAP transporter, DctM subunit [Treponema socranskii subsp. socranskii VPI DR56BR1116 = ATCC 35536]|uniref:TRAP transporter, DctM subunit n=1 Tax=Treponema socranskii subsp. socranskii VPI DR56BR1116 = ATCC 35536 TaxID=1125725 RepID=U2LGE9_TRESO|nr:TRAP transporter large permease [Treponema socranskii]ERF59880.1 TRAP transporter, DctM subunit [Treponema socranskii subsp. socranskii VPI DR56BR1116 = ATCC 35536]ERK03376.1 TRAP transporter, DctM subunit [Treponema socranskii subsp. socranskii VPI DR56BR1116 = ATCC 35536]